MLMPDPDSSADATLLEAFRDRRDEQAFTALVRRHLPLVFHTARSRLGSAALAEEAAQTTFARLAAKASAVAQHPERFKAWLYRTAWFEASDLARKEARLSKIPLPQPEDPTPMDRPELHDRLHDALNGLPELDRELVLRHCCGGEGYKEIAAAVGKSAAACQKRVERAGGAGSRPRRGEDSFHRPRGLRRGYGEKRGAAVRQPHRGIGPARQGHRCRNRIRCRQRLAHSRLRRARDRRWRGGMGTGGTAPNPAGNREIIAPCHAIGGGKQFSPFQQNQCRPGAARAGADMAVHPREADAAAAAVPDMAWVVAYARAFGSWNPLSSEAAEELQEQPDRALSSFRTMPPGPERDAVFSAIANHFAATDPEQVISIAESVKGPLKMEIAPVIEAIFIKSPEQALAALPRLMPFSSRTGFRSDMTSMMDDLLGHLAETRPHEAKNLTDRLFAPQSSGPSAAPRNP